MNGAAAAAAAASAALPSEFFFNCIPKSKTPSTTMKNPSTQSKSFYHSYLPISSSTISYSYHPLPPRLFRSRPHRLPSHQTPLPPKDSTTTQQKQQQHKSLLVETLDQNRKLRNLLGVLSKKGSNPLRLLEEGDEDWNNDQFWAVVRFLKETGRIEEALQVFDHWKNRETSRVNEANHSRIVRLLCEGGFMEEAVSMLREMENCGLSPSLAVYNSIVHEFARKGEFDRARGTVAMMAEMGLNPVAETYHGFIQACGKNRMYDEMSKCVKRMVSEGCSPNEVTYNMLMVEFARGGLLERMEGVHRTLTLKRMNLLPSTLVAMLEAYADLGVLDKMEKACRKVLSSKAYLKESVVRKMALVYIENFRFARLEEFGNEVASRTGKTYLVWCLLLLSCALLLSRKGMDSIVREMKVAKFKPNITFTNVLALAYVKMKDFRDLDALLSQVGAQNSKPDMVTIGVLFDACASGYEGTRTLEVWRRNGFLDQSVEMNTDPLVLAAFGKGSFLKSCEELYSSLGTKAKEKKVWTYIDMIRLAFKNSKRKDQLVG